MKRNANEQRKSPNSFSAHATLRNLSVATESAPELMSWFAAGHEVLWIPIHEVSDGPEGLKYAQAEAAHLGGSRLLRGWLDCYDLPIGIKGGCSRRIWMTRRSLRCGPRRKNCTSATWCIRPPGGAFPGDLTPRRMCRR